LPGWTNLIDHFPADQDDLIGADLTGLRIHQPPSLNRDNPADISADRRRSLRAKLTGHRGFDGRDAKRTDQRQQSKLELRVASHDAASEKWFDLEFRKQKSERGFNSISFVLFKSRR
jgi:hypothetical protein